MYYHMPLPDSHILEHSTALCLKHWILDLLSDSHVLEHLSYYRVLLTTVIRYPGALSLWEVIGSTWVHHCCLGSPGAEDWVHYWWLQWWAGTGRYLLAWAATWGSAGTLSVTWHFYLPHCEGKIHVLHRLSKHRHTQTQQTQNKLGNFFHSFWPW